MTLCKAPCSGQDDVSSVAHRIKLAPAAPVETSTSPAFLINLFGRCRSAAPKGFDVANAHYTLKLERLCACLDTSDYDHARKQLTKAIEQHVKEPICYEYNAHIPYFADKVDSFIVTKFFAEWQVGPKGYTTPSEHNWASVTETLLSGGGAHFISVAIEIGGDFSEEDMFIRNGHKQIVKDNEWSPGNDWKRCDID